MSINDEQLEIVRRDLSVGVPLNFTMLGRIFGEEFWQLIVIGFTGCEIHADKVQIVVQEKK